ncbi:ABC transporter ATP-binding protein [Mycobacterium antarcticum]|uniref:ABC transporter ATP-binding protein n=1 Tax=Mycolicibacterium sp. TUM20984 TaxID=3023368 RepID=UPI0024E0C4EF|nr:ABC transporter ATP-binding protein [Mycolicibacterium sp. TUM20984]
MSSRGGTPLVDEASLTVDQGQIVGLVGESGSGKSTMCRAIAALLPPGLRTTSGRITLGEHRLTDLSPSAVHRLRPRGIAMVFQDPLAALSPVMKLGDQVTEAIRARQKVSGSAAQGIALELFERMGVDDPARRMQSYVHQLSGGQRQRVMLAVALAADPVLLLADEPTSAVDVFTQKQILELVNELARERDMGVLLVSHDYGVVANTCTHTAVMYDGQIVERGPTKTVLGSPAHPYTRMLIESIPSVHARRPALTVIPPASGPEPPPGSCPFYRRCPHALAGPCTDEYGYLESAVVDHSTACVRAAESAIP